MCAEKIFIVSGLISRTDNPYESNNLEPTPAESRDGARKAMIESLLSIARESGLAKNGKFDDEQVSITASSKDEIIGICPCLAQFKTLDKLIPATVDEIIIKAKNAGLTWKLNLYESEVIEDPPVEPPKFQTEVHIEKVLYIIHPRFGNNHTKPYGVFLVSDGLDTKKCRTKGDMVGDKGPQYITFKRKRYKVTITGRAGNELISLKPMA